MRPSSKASRDAAASNIPSDGSHPPLGTDACNGTKKAIEKKNHGQHH